MENSSDFWVKVGGPGMDFFKSIGESEAKRLVVALVGRGGVDERVLGSALSEQERPSVREYLGSVGAKRAVDKICALGVYWRDFERQRMFSREQVILALREAAEKVPKNLSRDLAWAVGAGWLAREGGRGEYRVTVSGIRAVEERFSAQVVKETRKRKVR